MVKLFFSNSFQIYGSFPTYIGGNETIFVLAKLFLLPAKLFSRTLQESVISFVLGLNIIALVFQSQYDTNSGMRILKFC